MSAACYFIVQSSDSFLAVEPASVLDSGSHIVFGDFTVGRNCARHNQLDTVFPVLRVEVLPSQWQFAESESVWRPCAPSSQKELELRFQMSQCPVIAGPMQFVHKVAHLAAGATPQVYLIDLSAMTQLNVATGGKRKLRRLSSPSPTKHEPQVDDAPPQAPSHAKRERPAFVVLSSDSLPRDVERVTSSVVDVAPVQTAATDAAPAPAAASSGEASVGTLRDEDIVDDAPDDDKALVSPASRRHRPDLGAADLPAEPAVATGVSSGEATPAVVRVPFSLRSHGHEQAGGSHRLLFPSISTAIFKFDLAVAAEVATGVIATFLAARPQHQYPRLELSLIDFAPGNHETDTIRAFRKAWADRGNPDPRFNYCLGDVTSPDVRGRCAAIVNASNERFSGGPSVHGFARAIHVAAGAKGLEEDTKAKHGGHAVVATAYPVQIRTDSPLRVTSGTQYVIHVVGPNMNPHRPNCLYGNYERGKALLETSYQNILQQFAELCLK